MNPFLFLLLFTLSLFAGDGKYLVVVHPPAEPCGLFSTFDLVFANLRIYDKKPAAFAGIEVDFGTKGLYYEKERGPNFWNYYFEPIQIGKPGKKGKCIVERPYDRSGDLFFEENVPRHEAHQLIQKYLRVKPEILDRVELFVKEEMRGTTLGVHYRGTDKFKEAPITFYEEMLEAIGDFLETAPEDTQIFVATDDGHFLNRLIEIYGDRVHFQQEVERSFDNQPIHVAPKSPYKSGEEALIDCLLLSRCHFLIRTSSNLSRWSLNFNPDLPCLELSKRFHHYSGAEIRKMRGKKIP